MLIKCKGSVPKKEAHRIRMPTQAANPPRRHHEAGVDTRDCSPEDYAPLVLVKDS